MKNTLNLSIAIFFSILFLTSCANKKQEHTIQSLDSLCTYVEAVVRTNDHWKTVTDTIVVETLLDSTNLMTLTDTFVYRPETKTTLLYPLNDGGSAAASSIIAEYNRRLQVVEGCIGNWDKARIKELEEAKETFEALLPPR